MELTGLYLSPSIQGSYDLNHIWAIHTGIRWNFANQKASIQVKANDLFNSMEGNIDVTLVIKDNTWTCTPTIIHAT